MEKKEVDKMRRQGSVRKLGKKWQVTTYTNELIAGTNRKRRISKIVRGSKEMPRKFYGTS